MFAPALPKQAAQAALLIICGCAGESRLMGTRHGTAVVYASGSASLRLCTREM